jgi:hypothetical protein
MISFQEGAAGTVGDVTQSGRNQRSQLNIQNLILNKLGVRVWIGFIWLRIGWNGGLS